MIAGYPSPSSRWSFICILLPKDLAALDCKDMDSEEEGSIYGLTVKLTEGSSGLNQL